MYKKVFGLFLTLPLESLTIKQVVEWTNSDVDTVTAILMELEVQGDITGKRTFRLAKKHLMKHVTDIPYAI